jgi:riboflavin kinase/FMN adenylyltransferase
LGAFDGIHLGHQHLIRRLRQKVSPKGTLAVLTFRNHPNQVLKSRTLLPLICTFEHKVNLLEELDVDLLIAPAFTQETADQTYEQFLKEIKHFFPFSFLILGKGAVFGKRREGDELHIKALQESMCFEVEYVEKLIYQQEVISSARIRQAIQQGDFSLASAMLGRSYSIYSFLQKSEGPNGYGIMDVKGLCLPPDGTYSAYLKWEDRKLLTEAYIENNKIKIITNGLEDFLLKFIEIVFIN